MNSTNILNNAAPEPVFDPYVTAPDLTPLDLYTRLADTRPLEPEPAPADLAEPAVLAETSSLSADGLLCLVTDGTAMVLGREGLLSAIPLPETADAVLQAAALGETTLALAFEITREDRVYTRLDFYDLSDPAEPALLGQAGLDGAFLSCQAVEDGRFFLTTSFAADDDTLPARHRGENTYTIPAQKVLMAESAAGTGFTLGGLFQPDGTCAGWFAALGADPAVTLLNATQALVTWSGESRTEQTWPDGAYQAAQATTRAETGAALLTLDGRYWSLTGALTLEGTPELARYTDDGALCVAAGLTSVSRTQYEDPERGWTLPGEETVSTGLRVYLFDPALEPLNSLDLGEGDIELLGLYGSSLYYRTPADGLLRMAWLTDPGAPLAAPLAEVGSFADFAILTEGYALGLQRREDGQDYEAVLLNLSNPTHITRKPLRSCVFSAQARLLIGFVGEGRTLAAVTDEQRLSVLEATALFGPALLEVYAAPESPSRFLGTSGLALLVWSQGYALLDPDTGALIAP